MMNSYLSRLFFSLFVLFLHHHEVDAVTSETTKGRIQGSSIDVKELECGMRLLAVDYAKSIQPWRNNNNNNHNTSEYKDEDDDDVFQHIRDALEIPKFCGSDQIQQQQQQQNHQPPKVWKQDKARILFKKQKHKDNHSDNSTQETHPIIHKLSPAALISYCSSKQSSKESNISDAVGTCVFVNATTSTNKKKRSNNNSSYGTLEYPLDSLHDALDLSRAMRRRSSDSTRKFTIILRQGIHSLAGRPLALSGRDDNNLIIMGFPSERVWVIGGIQLPSNLDWKPIRKSDIINRNARSSDSADNSHQGKASNMENDNNSKKDTTIWVANLTQVLQDWTVPKIAALFSRTPHKRYFRARYPNSNPEIDQWGYASPDNWKYSIDSSMVDHWHKPPPGGVRPTFDKIALPKNDSDMAGYNLYASGHGGICTDLWGPNADSYWCSNASAGGWAEVDYHCAMRGQLQIPIGVTVNASSDTTHGPHVASWANDQFAPGAIIHAWHSQSWAMHMFMIEKAGGKNAIKSKKEKSNQDDSSYYSFEFYKGGGNQGGRNWCRCDECTYAAQWCKQHENPPNNNDDRLISKNWMIENILVELDQPGEFYYNHTSQLLYVIPNETSSSDHSHQERTWRNNLQFAMTENLMTLKNITNITIANLGFRDTAPTYMGEWSAPSGGDWALHRGGAIFLDGGGGGEDEEKVKNKQLQQQQQQEPQETPIDELSNILIENCHFRRLDGTAIFLSRRTRHVTIQRNKFEWMGENAIATWGETEKYNATNENYPMYTMIHENFFREIGIFQKQSSGYGHAKTALSSIQKNIMFNMPRAAINFNDMMGGGDIIQNNLIFNTCRESGDHGAINTWDRQPFMTKLRTDDTSHNSKHNNNAEGGSSFTPLPRQVISNFIFANYGASQGLDNDDGSSWHHVHDNVFYASEGFKMDYGGHDSIFENNLVISFPYDNQQCIMFHSFLKGHEHIVRNNRCIVSIGLEELFKQQQRQILEPGGSEKSTTSSVSEGLFLPPSSSILSKYFHHEKKYWRALADTQTNEPEHYNHDRYQNVRRNEDEIGGNNINLVANLAECKQHQNAAHGTAILQNNSYFTPHGKAFYMCRDISRDDKDDISLEDMQKQFSMEQGSTSNVTPSAKTIIKWSKRMLYDGVF